MLDAKKRKSQVKEVRNPNDYTQKSSFLLLLSLVRLEKQTLGIKNPSWCSRAHLSTLMKKEKPAKKELIILSLSMQSPLLSSLLASVTPLSSVRARGVPDLFPHCQIANRSPYKTARLPGLLLQQQQTGPSLQSRRPARKGEGGGGRSHLSVNFMRDLIR